MASGFGALASGIGKVGAGIGKGVSAAGKQIPGGWKGGLKRVATGDMTTGMPPKRYPMDEKLPKGSTVPSGPGAYSDKPSVIDKVRERIQKAAAESKATTNKKSLTPPPEQQPVEEGVGGYTPNWRINPRK